MSKLKTRRAAAKRFSFTATGKIKRRRAFHRHNFTDCQSKTAKVRGRKPTAGKVLLQYLGRTPDLRAALRTCGIFAAESDRLDPAVRARIHDDLGDSRDVLEVDEL
jgi:large subunit ribosomal protein L35